MIDRDASRTKLVALGFDVRARIVLGSDGGKRCDLTGRGPRGAFVVSAPTEAEAYWAAVEQFQAVAAASESPEPRWA